MDFNKLLNPVNQRQFEVGMRVYYVHCCKDIGSRFCLSANGTRYKYVSNMFWPADRLWKWRSENLRHVVKNQPQVIEIDEMTKTACR